MSYMERWNATGATTMAESLAPNVSFEILEIRLHLNAAADQAQNLTMTLNSRLGVAYDVRLSTTAMNTVQDVLYQPTRPIQCLAGDTIDFAWVNTTNSKTWGLEVVYKRIS